MQWLNEAAMNMGLNFSQFLQEVPLSKIQGESRWGLTLKCQPLMYTAFSYRHPKKEKCYNPRHLSWDLFTFS